MHYRPLALDKTFTGMAALSIARNVIEEEESVYSTKAM